MATTDFCDGDYLGAYRCFLEHFVANISTDDQLPVKMSRRDVRECEVAGEIADITLQHLNQRICPPSLQAYLVKLVRDEFKIMFEKQPEECGYRLQEKSFSPLKFMQAVTNKVNEICQRYLDNSRLALLPPPPSTPLPLASSYAIKNRRRKMEDRSVVLHDLHTMFSIKNDAVVNYYAVFDGHGGQETATYCAAHLHQYLIESPYYPAEPELALRDAFRTTDYRFIENDDTKNSGATAVCALLYDKTLYIAWAGDSQAALIKNGRGINLTVPHKPERPDEKARIESLGGQVVFFNVWRVNGILNVSRSLGDSKYKPYVSDEPDIRKIELDGTEDFLVVACDGFWERATDDIVASLLYEYVCHSNPYEYNSASEALVNWAKQNLSDDNISVIVVFLTPPVDIACKTLFGPKMEPGFEGQQPYDLDFGFAKQQQQPADLPPLPHTNGNGEAYGSVQTVLEPVNGRHRPKPPRYNDDDDDEDEEEEDDDIDLGPETNVDTVDEAPEDFGKLDQAMGHNYPDELLVKMHASTEEELPLEINDHQQNEPIPEADNVADSEDSEDEWNYYRPEDGKNAGQSKDPALVEKADRCEEKDLCSPKPYEDDNLDSQPVSGDSQAEPETEPEPEPEPEPEVDAEAEADADDLTADYDDLYQLPVARDTEPEILPQQTDSEAETTAIPDDFPYDKSPDEEPNKQFEQPYTSELQIAKPEHTDKFGQSEQLEKSEQFEQLAQHEQLEQLRGPEQQPVQLEEPEQSEQPQQLEEQQCSEQPVQVTQQCDLSRQEEEREQLESHSLEALDQLGEEFKVGEQQPKEQEEELDEEDDMESHLNPDAAEFVPTVTTPPMMPQLLSQMSSDLIAGSPLKQSQRDLKNRKIPSEAEFQQEICRRPSDIEDSTSDFSNGESSPLKESLGGFDDEQQRTVINPLNLDESEVSSTKAEFGDENNLNFSVASELYKTGFSATDCSYVSDRSDIDFSKDAMTTSMTTSMTPGDFKAAFELELDLNKVHELNDEDDDAIPEVQNGSFKDKIHIDDKDIFVGETWNMDLKNFMPQQPQNAQVFSAVLDEKVSSDNKDMFMNLRNTEHGYDYEPEKMESNFIDTTTEISKITSTDDEAIQDLQPSNNLPVYASNNPFAADYVSSTEQECDIPNITDNLQNVNLNEPETELVGDNSSLTPEESVVQKSTLEEVMLNPLDLNFGVASTEQRCSEPILLSPVREPEVMSSKYEEENLISQSFEVPQVVSSQSEQKHEIFSNANHVENFSVPPIIQSLQSETEACPLKENLERDVNAEGMETKSINLSESLQEFTGLEEQLCPIPQETNKMEAAQPPILKENLVDEQKDVEEAKAPSPIPHTKIEDAPLITNESSLLSNETPAKEVVAEISDVSSSSSATVAAASAVAAATVAVAATATAAVAKASAVTNKSSKAPATSKVGAKSATPMSPTKAAAAAKSGASATSKKPTVTSSSARTKPAAAGAAGKAATSTLGKTTAMPNKAPGAPKTATTAGTKAPGRATALSTAPKSKALGSVASKAGSTSADKKPTTNGEVKPAPIGRSAPAARAAPKAAVSSSAAAKPALVKSSTASRATPATTAATRASRPASAATATATGKPGVASRLSTGGVSSSTNGSARPKTAPAAAAAAATKSRVSSLTKSPMIDKQIKESANKQISSARSSGAAAKPRASTVTSSNTNSAATKRVSLVQKQSAAALATAPATTKKPAPIAKPGAKTAGVGTKLASKVSSTTKSAAAPTNTLVQNGVCEVPENKTVTNTTTTTTTTATTNIEEDIPKKDISPIEPLTDNQLITAE